MPCFQEISLTAFIPYLFYLCVRGFDTIQYCILPQMVKTECETDLFVSTSTKVHCTLAPYFNFALPSANLVAIIRVFKPTAQSILNSVCTPTLPGNVLTLQNYHLLRRETIPDQPNGGYSSNVNQPQVCSYPYKGLSPGLYHNYAQYV